MTRAHRQVAPSNRQNLEFGAHFRINDDGSVSRLCLDCEAHRRAPRAWRPCERHQQPNLSAAADTLPSEFR